MKFPDVERALGEVLPVKVVAHIPKNLASNVPLIQIIPIPHSGVPERFLKQERYQLFVYGKGRTNTKKLTEEIVLLLDGKYFSTTEGLIDRVDVVELPSESPLEDDVLNSFSISILTNTRPLKGLT